MADQFINRFSKTPEFPVDDLKQKGFLKTFLGLPDVEVQWDTLLIMFKFVDCYCIDCIELSAVVMQTHCSTAYQRFIVKFTLLFFYIKCGKCCYYLFIHRSAHL